MLARQSSKWLNKNLRTQPPQAIIREANPEGKTVSIKMAVINHQAKPKCTNFTSKDITRSNVNAYSFPLNAVSPQTSRRF